MCWLSGADVAGHIVSMIARRSITWARAGPRTWNERRGWRRSQYSEASALLCIMAVIQRTWKEVVVTTYVEAMVEEESALSHRLHGLVGTFSRNERRREEA